MTCHRLAAGVALIALLAAPLAAQIPQKPLPQKPAPAVPNQQIAVVGLTIEAPASIVAGSSANVKVTTSLDAPQSGFTVTLESSDPTILSVNPASVSIPVLKTEAVFSISASSSPVIKRSVTLTAKLGASQKTATVEVTPKPAAPLAWDGTLPAQQTLPFAKNAVFTVKTKGGVGDVDVTFSASSNSSQFQDKPPTSGNSLAAPAVRLSRDAARSAAIQDALESTRPAGPTTTNIYFVGAPGATPPTSPVTLTVTAKDEAGATIRQTTTLSFTRANGKPVVTSIVEDGQPTQSNSVLPIPWMGRFKITVSGESWSPQDEGADVIAVYDGNFHYGVEALPGFRDGSNPVYSVVFEDINKGKTIKIYLKNMYGSSNPISVKLPTQKLEAFPEFPLAPATSENRYYDLTNHPEIGVNVIPNSEGIDQFSLSNVTNERGKTPACGETSIFYVGAKTIEVSNKDVGTATVVEQPSVNAPFNPDGKVRVKWVTQVGGRYSYQTHYAIKIVAGICPARKRN